MDSEPDCIDCGHPAEEHNYDPSGCAGTQCLHADSYDEGGWICACTDYNPGSD